MKMKKVLVAIGILSVLSTSYLVVNAANINLMNIRGDVNGDSVLNVTDLIELKKIVLGENREEAINKMIVNKLTYVYNLPQDEIIFKTYSEFKEYLTQKNVDISAFQNKVNEENFNDYVLLYINPNQTNKDLDLSKVSIDNNNLYVNVYTTYNPGTTALLVYISKDEYLNQTLSIKYENRIITTAKPVIYLYPEKETKVDVKLDYKGNLMYTYPKYNNGWSVTASPDGMLKDNNGKEYSYLFWDGNDDIKWDMSKGFVVKGEDTVAFLQEKLEYMGLTPEEYNEFIVYWMTRMEKNKYNLISFQDDLYTDNAVLDITPKPDSMLRVFMAFKALDEYIEVPKQELKTFERKGFAVVEWGGAEVKEEK